MLHEFVVYMRRIIWEGELWTYRKLNTKTLKWPEPVVKEKVASEKTNGEKDKIKETNSNLRTVKSIISVTCSLSLTRWCQDFSAGQFNASYFKFPSLMPSLQCKIFRNGKKISCRPQESPAVHANTHREQMV